MMSPRYVTPAGGIRRANVIVILAAVAAIVFGVVLALVVEDGIEAVWISTGLLLLTDAFIWLILPRRYEVYDDRLRIVFPLHGWDIPFATIASVQPAIGLMAYGYWGVRFATAPGQAVEVRRRNSNLFGRPNLIISPAGRDEFLRHLEGLVTVSRR